MLGVARWLLLIAMGDRLSSLVRDLILPHYRYLATETGIDQNPGLLSMISANSGVCAREHLVMERMITTEKKTAILGTIVKLQIVTKESGDWRTRNITQVVWIARLIAEECA